jgi:phage RecT family recombinase
MTENKNLPATIDQIAGKFLQETSKTLSGYAIRKYDQTAFLKSAMLAISDNKSLADCLQTVEGKKSLIHALKYASTTGLSLNPQEGRAALIAYGGKIQFQIMKNGLIDLALESGKVEFITADYVKENDKFKLIKTINGDSYEFEPALKDRGAILGYFAAIKLVSGMTHVKWFTSEEVLSHRKKYSSNSQMPEMGYGIKTVMKALLRSISISRELDAAVSGDDFFEISTESDHGVSADDTLEKLKAQTTQPKQEKTESDLL